MKRRHLLAVGPWYPETAGNFFVEAFERLGWNVVRCGPTYFDHGHEHGVKWDEDRLPIVDIPLMRNASWYIDDYITQATKLQGVAPDLVWICEEDYHNEIFNTKKIPSVLWSCDGWQNSFDRIMAIKPTAAFTNHPFGVIPQRQAKTPEGWQFMPAAAAPWIHKNRFVPHHTREIDFILLATPYGYRPQICEALTQAGLHVASGLEGTKQYVELSQWSSLTYHNANTQEEVKFRFFEAAAMGVVNIADYTRLYAWLGYLPFTHYIPIDLEKKPDGSRWPNVDNLIWLVKDYRSRPEVLQAISTAAWYTTMSKNTYYHRAYSIMKQLGIDPQVTLSEIKTRSLRENGVNNAD